MGNRVWGVCVCNPAFDPVPLHPTCEKDLSPAITRLRFPGLHEGENERQSGSIFAMVCPVATHRRHPNLGVSVSDAGQAGQRVVDAYNRKFASMRSMLHI
jgi:hypothetical protein